jgi:hypothetical protein
MKKIAIIISSILFTITGVNANVWYVKSDGTAANNAENAKNWKTACADLQAVINHSEAGDEIWVAAGTYKPNRKADDLHIVNVGHKDNAFVLKGNVKIYGGFPSNANDSNHKRLDARDPDENKTILSGETGNNKSDQVYHVVIATAGYEENLHLDGFTIKGGDANGEGTIRINGFQIERYGGGGLFLITHKNSHTMLTDNTFINNTAVYGGSIAVATSHGGDVDINNNLFKSNTAEYGGGIYIFTGDSKKADFTIENNVLTNNTATYGGGIYAVTFFNGKIQINDNHMSNNSAKIHGGALSAGNYFGGNIIVNGDVYTNNSAVEKGSGIFARAEVSSIDIQNSTIKNNTGGKNISSLLNYGGKLNVIDCNISD